MKPLLSLTRHAIARMSQRGIREDDAELIPLIGTEVGDGYLVRTKDCQAAERELKDLLQRIWRIHGKRLVVRDGKIVTAYHSLRRHQCQHRRLCHEGDVGH